MEYAGLLVGLGNPSRQYEGTRHNLGFFCIDAVLHEAEREGRVESLAGGKFNCELWRCTLGKGRSWWLAAKPQTFMNCSGESVQPLLAWYKLSVADLVVVHDELDISPGSLRFKTGGGNAGHNGLKSITQMLGTPDFHRLRLGIGRPPFKGDVTNWVLGHPSTEENNAYGDLMPHAVQCLRLFAEHGSRDASTFALAVK